MRWDDHEGSLQIVDGTGRIITCDIERDAIATVDVLGCRAGFASFSSDGRNVAFFNAGLSRLTVYDLTSRQRTSTMQLLRGHQSVVFDAIGKYRVSEQATTHVVCVVESDSEFRLMTPSEVEQEFGISYEVPAISLVASSVEDRVRNE